MTAMQQIEALCIEARKHSMTYGEYIEKFKPQLEEPEPMGKKEQKIEKERKYQETLERKRTSAAFYRSKKKMQGSSGEAPKIRRGARQFKRIELSCVMCGERFTAHRRDARYCESCKQERARIRTREWNRTHCAGE